MQAVQLVVEAFRILVALRFENGHGVIGVLLLVRRDGAEDLPKAPRRNDRHSRIARQGKGFRRSNVPDPCSAENIEKCSGRGILLMEAYMDKVEYSRGGRRVRMIKKNA